MNEAETKLFLALMEQFRDKLSAAGSNDFDIRATPENADIIRGMVEAGDDYDLEALLKTYPSPYRGEAQSYYILSDTSLLRYLVRKITGKELP